MIARQPVERGSAPRPRAWTHVEYERRSDGSRYVGFVLDGGKVQRVIETASRIQALAQAQAHADRLNRRRGRS